jgi:hypothetical protein
VELPEADPIDEKYREQFHASSAPVLRELDEFKNSQLAGIAFASP